VNPRPSVPVGLLVVALAALPACRCAPTGPPPTPMPPRPAPTDAPAVQWKGSAIPVRVATGDPARRQGFAGVPHLAPDDGLLRVWPTATWVALGDHEYQVATEVWLCDATGTILTRDSLGPDARPMESQRHWVKSPQRIQYVLELPPGRGAKLGLDAGAQLTIDPALTGTATPSRPWLPDLPRGTLEVGGQTITVEIAHTAEARRTGLMFRDTLPADRGMLFVYPRARVLSFWMKNCPVPIDVAYLTADGRIVSIYTMQPGWHTPDDADLPGYPGASATPFALEMAGGWYAAHGVKAGDAVALPPEVEAWRREAQD